MNRSKSGMRAVCPCLLTRISYQVGSPWMFGGHPFFPDTGIPMRKIACMMGPLAEADPEPLGVAILKAKSLVFTSLTCLRQLELELDHVPGVRRAALGAQAAVEAHVL